MKKIHIPEYRDKLDKSELMHLVKQNQLIRMEVKKIQVLTRVPLSEMVDFQKLTRCFFREYPYSYGKYVARHQEKNEKNRTFGSK